ncbi:MAG: SdrD B-like domain-containing protein [Bacteroidota bacterium]
MRKLHTSTYAVPNRLMRIFFASFALLASMALPLGLSAQDIVIEARASCVNGSTPAMEDMYFVEIQSITGGSGSSYDVSVDGGAIQTFSGGSIFFGPFMRTDDGLSVRIVSATDGTNTGIVEVNEVVCGVNDGGQASGSFCVQSNEPNVPTGAILAQSQPGTFHAFGSSGQVQTYVLTQNGSIVASNANGLFTGLEPGDYVTYALNYRLDEAADVESFLAPGSSFQPFIDAADPNSMSGTFLDNACFTLCGPQPVTVQPCYSVGSTVFSDLDDNGIFEVGEGEDGIPGILVELYESGANPDTDDPIATDITDADGNYYFGGLDAGSYFLVIPDAPEDFPTSSSQDVTDTADNGEDNDDNGTQNAMTGSTSSPVFELGDGDGMSEPVATETGSGGTFDQDADEFGDMTQDFGFVPSLSIGSFVWIDDDNDGVFDVGTENGLDGVELELIDVGPDGVFGTADDVTGPTTTTMNGGEYIFSDLLPGNYVVTIPASNFDEDTDPAVDYPLSSTPTNLADDRMDNDDNGAQDGGAGTIVVSPVINLAAGEEPVEGPDATNPGSDQDNMLPGGDDNGDMTIDFGLIPSMSLGSTVFIDFDNDGIFEPGPDEDGIPNVTVNLYADTDGNGVFTPGVDEFITSDMTDPDGHYFFDNLPPGDYIVGIVDLPEDFPLSSTVDAGDPDDDQDDNDDNGIQDEAGDPVFSEAVTLSLNGEPTGEDTTQGGDQDAGDDDNGNMTVDFGFPPVVSLGSTVFIDANDDGIYDQGDPLEDGIPGVRVELYTSMQTPGTDMPVAVDVTDSNGDYFFDNLPPGMYVVYIPMPNTAYPMSSSPGVTANDPDADADDNDDNGIQTSSGDPVVSGIVTLTPGMEPTGIAESGSGGTQDDEDNGGIDANGNMTVDFGFTPLPMITHTKMLTSIEPTGTANNYDVTYTIVVRNNMGGPGEYDLFDTPTFENDITINTASFTTDAPGVTGGPLSPPPPLSLGEDVAIAANGVHTYELTFNVTLDLSADPGAPFDAFQEYTACGNMSGDPFEPSPGEGLYNLSQLSTDDDPDTFEETDEACGDLPFITHRKDLAGIVSGPNPDGSYDVRYQVVVQNVGGAAGTYDLTDRHFFDDDVVINTASYSSMGVTPSISGAALSLDNGAPNQLGQDDQLIEAGATHEYILNYNVTLDLSPGSLDGGDNIYTACGVTPPNNTLGPTTDDAAMTGQGLYNQSGLDLDNDGDFDEMDEICIDLPFITHRKDAVTVSDFPNDDGQYVVTYTIVVDNLGQEEGDYTLTDTPNFDDDITINAATYSTDGLTADVTDAALLTTNGMTNTFPMQTIAASETHTYTLRYLVTLDLAPGSTDGGDNEYTACGTAAPDNTTGPTTDDLAMPGEGLYNATTLDLDGDGIPDEEDEICADLPIFSIGNQVWFDTDNDGMLDAGEVGVDGVTVELFFTDPVSGDEVSYGTVTTSDGGYYLFDMLPAGDYEVVILEENFLPGGVLEGYYPSGATLADGDGPTTPNDDEDNDSNGASSAVGAGGITTMDISSGTVSVGTEDSTPEPTGEGDTPGFPDDTPDDRANYTVDFGFYTLNLGDLVWLDVNNDGMFNPGEEGVPGVTVQLFTNDATPVEIPVGPDGIYGTADDALGGTSTDGVGNYLFQNLPEGEYIVVITPPAGLVSSTGTGLDGAVTGPFEGPMTPDPDNNTEDDDNGSTADGGPFDGLIVSLPVELEPGSSPMPGGNNIVDNGAGETTDPTVDFGLFQPVFDLALRKTLAPGQEPMVMPGDDVEFLIEIINQGNVAGTDISVIDYIPAGFVLSTSAGSNSAGDPINDDWTAATDVNGAPAASATIAGPFNPGDDPIELILTLTVEGGTDGETLVNVAEISAATGNTPGGPLDDIDSTPNNDPEDDAGGAVGTPSDNATTGTGEGDPGDDEENTDEDDADPAQVFVNPFDLALIKQLGDMQSESVMPGQDVTFTITVTNQGMVDADNITITDYIPDGFTLSGANTLPWAAGTDFNGGPTAELTLTDFGGAEVLTPNAMVEVEIILTVDGGLVSGTQLINVAEISNATDGEGGTVEDIDSSPDNMPENDPGGLVNSGADDSDTGFGTGTPGDGDAVGDEDDADPEDVIVAPFDLALTKVVTDPADRMVMPGDLVTFTIEVTNQGGITATDIVVVDYVPTGLTFSLANNPLWTGGSNTAPEITISGPLAPGAIETVTIVLEVDGGTDGESLVNVAEIAQAEDNTGTIAMDIDSDPNRDPNDDAGGAVDTPSDDVTSGDGTGDPGDTDPNTDEDDADPAQIFVNPFDLALIKQLSDGQSASVMPGDEVSFTITIDNQGMIDGDNIEITDYIPDGFTLSGTSISDGWAAGTDVNGDPTATITLTDFGSEEVLQPGETVEVEIILVVDGGVVSGTQLINVAEISNATDGEGGMVEDIDSDPNNDPGDDAGGLVNSGADDSDTGNGTGAVGDGDAAGDEDDADPEDVIVAPFDLALTKVVTDPADRMVMPGDLVTFTIEVTNQGAITATDIVVVDYVPTGLTFSLANNPLWTGGSNTAPEITIPGPLAPGAIETITIVLEVDGGTDGETLVNVAEIAQAEDNTGTIAMDIDSDPNRDPNDDAGGAVDTPSDDVTSGDGTGMPGDTDANTDEDDADPAQIFVNPFDLALIKELGDDQDEVVMPGDDVTFTITVSNQGMVDGDNITITDYIPSGFTLSDASINDGWAESGDNAVITLTSFNGLPTLQPGAFVEVDIILTVDGGVSGNTRLVNVAEISNASDGEGNFDVEDIDSTPNDDPTDDAGGEVNTPSDDVASGDGTGDPGDTDPNTDEDDADPEDVIVAPFDLALIKQLGEDQDPMVQPGDLVTFTIEVTNQGMVDAQNIQVVDYVPDGLIFNEADNDDWALDQMTGFPVTTIEELLEPGQTTTVDIVLEVGPGTDGQSLINVAEIARAEDGTGEEAEDIDSTPNQDPDDDAGGEVGTPSDDSTSGDGSGDPGDTEETTDEDDADPAIIMVNPFDLALIKQLGDDQEPVVMPGDLVTFTITVANQGMVTATDIVVVDYVPDGFTFDIANNPSWDGVTLAGDPTTTIEGPLDPGDQIEVDIILTVDGGVSGNTQLVNVAEISDAKDGEGGEVTDIDSTPNDDPNDDAGGMVNSGADDSDTGNGTGEIGDGDAAGDEDDADPEDVFVAPFDLALIKQLADDQSPMVQPGDLVTFTITVTNQGLVDATDVVVTDYVPTGLIFNAGDNPNWDGTDPSLPTTTIDALPFGETTTVDIILEVGPGTDGQSLINVAEISSANDGTGTPAEDIDSTPNQDPDDDAGGEVGTGSDDITSGDGTGNPGDPDPNTDEDDADPAVIMVNPFDLALIKQLSDGQSDVVMPGDEVSFTITVTNQGMVTATEIEVTDYVPSGFIFDPALNPDWDDTDPLLPTTTIDGPLLPGAITTVEIILTVNGGVSGNTQLVNVAEISDAKDGEGGEVTDIDSTPDDDPANDAGGMVNSGADDSDTGNGTGTPGDGDAAGDEDDSDPEDVVVAPFDLALIKQLADGQEPLVQPGDLVTFTIEVSNQGLVTATNIEVTDYVPAGLLFDIANNADWTGGTPTAPSTTISGPLAPGETTSVNIVLEVAPGTGGQDLINVAEISNAQDNTMTDVDDFDSTPDDIPDNDAGGEVGTPSDDSTSGDGSGDPGDTEETTDEDDADPALISVGGFDLALIKELGADQDNVVMPGDDVTFTITVFNQGMITATEIEVIDYVQPGFSFDPALNPEWTGGTATEPIATIDGPLEPGEMTTIDIILTVDGGVSGNSQLINIAEIFKALDGEGGETEDIDSTPDDDPTNDPGGQVNSGSDDVNDGDGSGVPGDSDPVSDEDDADPEDVVVAPFDLALVKQLGADQSPMVEPGDDVTFTIEVFNQGMVTATGIEVTDYVPDGLIFNADDNPDWDDTDPSAPTIVIDGPLLPGESTTVDIILEVAAGTDGESLVNVAEISEANDATGNPAVDIDSTPDDDPDNDAGGEPGTPSDDVTSGDGSGDPGDTDANTDEDDADPALIMVNPFDLALIKQLSDGQSEVVMPGDEVSFTITVTNQGMVTATAIEVTDYVPSGFSFDAALNPDWDDTDPTAPTTTIDGPLLPGETTTVDIVLTVNGGVSSNTQLVNVAEISDAKDGEGGDVTDIDSTPDSDPNNDPGGMVNSGADDSDTGNGTGTPGDGDAAGDEDDSDPEDVVVAPFDLALIKQLADGQSPMVQPGDLVTFTITVTNQGMVDATDVVVTDYVPSGLIFNAGDNPSWDGTDPSLPTTTIDALAAGETTTVDIVLQVGPGTDGESLINVAEISAANDGTGTPAEDIDSTPNNDPTDDAGGEVGTPSDDSTSGDGSGMPGDTEETTDEDDADPALIMVNPFDLALIKQLSDGQSEVVMPGDEVSFTITVTNQGMVTATAIEVTDYVPSGFTFDATLNPDWDDTDPTAPTTTIDGPLLPGETTTVDIVLTVNGGVSSNTQLVNVAEISDAKDGEGGDVTDIDSTPDSDPNNDPGGMVNSGADDSDTGNGTGTPGDGDAAGDEDDSDPEDVVVAPFDLALIKQLADGQSPMVQPGDLVTFTITVTNQGMVDATDVVVTDYVPSGLIFNAGDNPSWDGTDPSLPTTTIDALAAGETTTVDIVLQVGPGTDGESLINVAEISAANDGTGTPAEDIDSTPNNDPTDDAGGEVGTPSDDSTSGDGSGMPGDTEETTDEDDADPALIMVNPFDLALIKQLSDGQSEVVMPGDEVSFTITVTNQGMVTATAIEVTDYVPSGFTFDATLNPDWDDTDPTAPTTTIDGPLLPGETTTVDIILTVNGGVLSNTQLVNVAEISDAKDGEGGDVTDIDSTPDSDPNNDPGGMVNSGADDSDTGNGTGTPGDGDAAGDEDDSDPEDVIVAPFDLALIKQLADSQSPAVMPGDNVTFTIEVSNQGMVTATNIVVTDYVPTGLIFNTADNPLWTGGTSTEPTTTIAGPLAPGASTTVDIVLEVAPGTDGQDLVNVAEISEASDATGTPAVDIDSTPDDDPTNDAGGAVDTPSDNVTSGDGTGDPGDTDPNTDEDDADPAVVSVGVFDLALIKELGDGQDAVVNPGDEVTFTITVSNQGMVAATQIEVTDYVPSGFTFDPALNPAWTGGTATEPTTTIAGPLAPGESTTVDIVLTVNGGLTSNTQLVNVAEISSALDGEGGDVEDIDSTPDGDPTNDAGGQVNTGSDNVDGGDGTGDPGDTDPTSDEDDADPEDVIIAPFDLALIKELADGQSASVEPGDTVRYTITVFNQGGMTANNIEISDYIPDAMTFEAGAGDGVVDNTSLGWTESGGIATNTLVITGGLLSGESVTIDLFLTLDSPLLPGTAIDNFAEISNATDITGEDQDDIDSEFDQDPDDDDLTQDNETGGDGSIPGEDDDDHDVATIITQGFDLALIKQLSPGQSDQVAPGDTIAYTLTVINQGMIAADNVEITDYIPASMSFAADAGNGTDDNASLGWMLNADGNPVTTLTTAGGGLPSAGLLPGESASVEIYLILDAPLAAGTSIDNFAEISDATDENGDPQDDIDSTPDDMNDEDNVQDDQVDGNGNDGEDEDDHDVETINVLPFDLALVKTLADGQNEFVEAGDTVLFTITVFNQGGIAADSILISDYAPSQTDGFLWDPTIPVNMDNGWMQVGMAATDLLLIQTTLTVADGDLPAGGLLPGETATVDIALVVNPAMVAEMELVNTAEITDATDDNGNEVIEDDSPMDDDPFNDPFLDDNEIGGDGTAGEDEDNSDPATIIVGGFDLALNKTLSLGQSAEVSPGDDVSFDINVFNQGAIPADNIEIVDYIPVGFLFDADLNPDWTDNGDSTASITLSVADGSLPAGGLEPGESTTVQIVLTVAPPMFPDYAQGTGMDPEGVEPGETLVNEAEIVFATDDEGEVQEDIDSTPDDEQGNDGDIDDDEINGGGPDEGEDEDDNDIAIVVVECYQDPGVNNTIEVCLGCDEAEVTINLFTSLLGLPNIGGEFSEGDLIFMDEDNNQIDIVDTDGNTFGDADFDPENVVIPGTLNRSLDYQIVYTIPAINDCPERSSIITIDIIDIQNLPCEGFTNISLGEDCEAEITPDLILSGNLTCANSLIVDLLDENGNSVGNIVDSDDIGQTFYVQLIDPQCNNVCWGQLLVEDKKAPEIECPENVSGFDGKDFICTDLDEILNQPGSVVFTGSPVISDNCTATEDLILTFTDLLLPYDPQCGIATILRTFRVEDESGNVAFCTQQITVRPPTLDDVMIPDPDDEFVVNCNDTFDALPNGNPTPEEVGGPTIMTALDMFDIPGNGSYCNIAASFEDGPRLVTCENTFKFVRTWNIYDWCVLDDEPIIFTQLIKVGDFTAPEVIPPTQDLDFNGEPDPLPLVFSTGNTDCTSNVIIPAGDATDNCDDNPEVIAYILPFNQTDVAPFGPYQIGEIAFEVPAGDHTLRYIATDNCDNSDTLDVPILVTDLSEPVAVCEDGLDVSLGGTGEAEICGEDIDRASYDDCSDITRLVAFVGDDNQPLTDAETFALTGIAQGGWRECITLTCNLLDDNPDSLDFVAVGLLVTDESGNSNSCWLDVLVEDKIAPLCIPPSPMARQCNEPDIANLPQDLQAAFADDPEGTAAQLDAVFGEAVGQDNCPDVEVSQAVIDLRSSCGTGVIIRSFSVVDGEGLTSASDCSQTITVLAVHDYTITFPADVEELECVAPDFNEVEFVENGCDLLTVTTVIDTFEADADECYKLRITYEVLNWCEYTTEEDPYVIPRDADNDDILEEPTFLHVMPRSLNTLTDDIARLDRDNNRNNGFISPLDEDDVDGTVAGQVPGNGPQPYGTDESRGAFLYRQFVKVYDEIPPVLTFEEQGPFEDLDGSCDEEVIIDFTLTDNCISPDDFDALVSLDAFFADVDGDGVLTAADFVPDNLPQFAPIATNNGDGTFTVTFNNNLPLGRHAIRVVGSDGCGNTDVALIIFEVTDAKAPTPVCISGLTATLMPDGNGGGMAAIWASEYVVSDSDDCVGPVQFAIYHPSQFDSLDNELIIPNPLDTGITLTCDDFGTIVIRVYAIDGSGLSDYCETTLDVQVFQEGICEDADQGNILGLIESPAGTATPDVEVSISDLGNMSDIEYTDQAGEYSFTQLPFNEDYTIEPSLEGDVDVATAVTTFDILIINRHILGIAEMESPYQHVIADVNMDNVINVIDVVNIRQVIMGIRSTYLSGPTWRFADQDYEFSANASDWLTEVFPEVYNANDLEGDVLSADFYALEMGNVSEGVIASSNARPESSDSRSSTDLMTDEIRLVAGNSYEIPFRVRDLYGAQGTIELSAGLELLDISYGLASAANLNMGRAAEGLISFSWDDPQAVAQANDNALLFTFKVRATTNSELSELIRLTDRITGAEGYPLSGGIANLNLTFGADSDLLAETNFELIQNSPNPFRQETNIGYYLPKDMDVTIVITDVNGRHLRTFEQNGTAGFNNLVVAKSQLNNASGVMTYTITADGWTASRRMVVTN